MNILMLTNTFLPHVGGVARSVASFAAQYRRQGHGVLVVAPRFPEAPASEQGVIRIPAIQHFNGSDFSVPVPIPGFLHQDLERFRPDVVHSHHPFLLGDTALRISAARNIPVVFTHHTQYEKYTHYMPGNWPMLKRFVVDLSVGYGNLCDAVIAPSQTIAGVLKQQGVQSPVEVIPTGVEESFFTQGDGSAFRRAVNIPSDAFVVGHVGRLAPEKNLEFLARAAGQFLVQHPSAWLLMAGEGPLQPTIRHTLAEQDVSDRVVMVGNLDRWRLCDAYHAMDVFAFASRSETQGMVLTEAMAAGVPVVALDGPGVREVVRDGLNGRLLDREDLREFTVALTQLFSRDAAAKQILRRAAEKTARRFSMARCANRALRLYQSLIWAGSGQQPIENSPWSTAKRCIAEKWKIWANVAEAVGDSLVQTARHDGASE